MEHAIVASIAAECILLDSGLLIATVKAYWNNRGTFPVPIDTHKSIVTAYELLSTLSVGKLPDYEDLGKQVGQARVSLTDEFELEAKTNSELRVHFCR